MNFGFTEEQDDLAALARRVLEDRVTHERLTELEASDGERFDRTLWEELGKLELLGIALPEDVGGSGYGLVEQCLVLREVGRTLAPVPVLPSVVSAMAIAEFGSSEQRERWVRPVVEGRAVITAAVAEPANPVPMRPSTTASRDGDGWRLQGVKTAVPSATIAELLLVPAAVDGQARVFLVEPSAAGLTITRQRTTNRETYGYVELDGVRVANSRDATVGGADTLEWMVDRTTVGLCALQLGICERALEHTAEYTKSRVQFERPIATFQAVGHRCADCYIDVEGIRLTLWQAAWRLAEGLPARQEVETAKFWASDGGHRVAHAVVHLHGGMGVATEYFVHRYFIHAKQIEFMLGSATEQALRIGDALAKEPA